MEYAEWDLEGKEVTALYDDIEVRGTVILSRIAFGAYAKHYINLDAKSSKMLDQNHVVIKHVNLKEIL
jgi:hypothetical protein